MSGININKDYTDHHSKEKNNSFEKVISLLNKDISLSGKKLKDRKKNNFYLDIYVLLSSGVDIKTTLDIISSDAQKKEDKELLGKLGKDIINGMGLSEAMDHSGKFSAYEIHSISIGEESGQLVSVIKNLCDYYSKKIEQKRKIINALSYPLIVMTTAVLAIAFMLRFIIPMFEDVFKRFNNKELPAVTRFIIHLSNFFSHNYLTGLFILVLIVILYFAVKKKPWHRKFSSHLLLRLPVFGEIFRKIYLGRFCMSMELLAGAKVPLINSIQLMKKMIGFYPLEVSLDPIEKNLISGKSLHESLAEFKVYDKRMVSLIKVAEEVNQLQEVFGKLKKQYNDDVDYRSNTMGNLLEPLIIIFIGLFVGIVLIAMYLPMFQLSTTIAN
jgi:type IV pilus assembly protein PilC